MARRTPYHHGSTPPPNPNFTSPTGTNPAEHSSAMASASSRSIPVWTNPVIMNSAVIEILVLTQSPDRPARYRESTLFDTMPSAPIAWTRSNKFGAVAADMIEVENTIAA
jgi:hypothetical protein